MKKIFTLLAMACVAFTGCTDEDSNSKYPSALTGDKIVFGASMNYESNGKQTRTVYGDKQTGKGGYTEIKWLEGDQVRIYCEQTLDATVGIGGVEGAAKRNYCDYTVAGDYVPSNTTPTDGQFETNHYVGLEASAEGDEGLCWGEGSHAFYGVYPSPEMLNKYADDNVAAGALKIEPNLVTAYLPNLQRPNKFVPSVEFDYEVNGVTEKRDLYVIHPSMRYAYMVAQQPEASATGNVDLVFKPIVTAVEMTLQNTGSAKINGITMISLSSNNVICGEFTCKTDATEITNVSSDDSYKAISIPVAADGSSITLNPGDKIKFTAFMILNTNLSSIDVTVAYANGLATKKATLSAGDLNIIQYKKKNFIANVGVSFSNAVVSVEMDKWMASITSDKAVSKLSIPAAGGAASGINSDGSTDAVGLTSSAWTTSEVYLEQKLSIDELWAQGIRCFEFTVDVNSGTAGNLGDSNVRCNTIDCGITLRQAVNKVKEQLLAHPTEFAMVIITYQQTNGWDVRSQETGVVTVKRNPTTFMTQLETFWGEVSSTDNGNWPVKTDNTVDSDATVSIQTGVALYSPSLSLSNARGKLFCIARPTSEEEDNPVTLSLHNYTFLAHMYGNCVSGYSIPDLPTVNVANSTIVLIPGWGAIKDKWVRRGYTTCAFHRGYVGNDNLKRYIDDNTDEETVLGYKSSMIGRPMDTSTNSTDVFATLKNDADANSSQDTYITENINKLTPNFKYSVQTSEGVSNTLNAWVQEWARVSDYKGKITGVDPSNPNTTRYYYWADSSDEKFGNVTSTFDKALADQSGNTIYINSLCGYFIDPKTAPNSCWPISLTEINGNYKSGGLTRTCHFYIHEFTGASEKAGMSGNIGRFAQWMNNKFYNYLLTKSLDGKSTGIIMMDRVSNNATTDPAGYYIPRIILANNPFKEINQEEASASVMRISIDEEEVNSDNSDDYKFAAPEKR